MGTKWYQKRTVVGTESLAVRTYKCPNHGVVLFSVPASITEPTMTEEVKCPQGDTVEVPKYDDSQKIK